VSKIWVAIALLGLVVLLYLSVIKPVMDQSKITGEKSLQTIKQMETNIIE
jgi:hypothetical protein